MELYAICEIWLVRLGVWPMRKFGWMLKIYLTLSVAYLLIPEIIFLMRNYQNVEEFGACFCELMVVCQGVYKLLLLIYHKHNWKIVIGEILDVFKECRREFCVNLGTKLN